VHAARPTAIGDLAPGEARAVPDGVLVGCGAGSAILLQTVQLEGKRRLEAAEFVKGQPIPPGTVLGR
jgi:methionyl-tRNA formyltransferase